jgi:peptide/nickel transport system permease protein
MTRALRLIRRRLINAVPVIFLVILGTYALLAAAPGDAVDAYIARSGGDAALIAELRERWGLEGSFLTRFVSYMWSLLRLDLGPSVLFNQPVVSVVMSRVAPTLLLMSAAIAVAFLFGSLLGVVAGARPGSVRDRLLSAVSLVFYATPGFWLGLMLIIAFTVKLGLLPLGGFETIASDKTGFARALDIARHLVMPTLALGIVYLALYLRLMRAGMVEAWRSDHVLLARAKGLPRRRLVLRHVARNALLPVVTMLGLQASTMLGGSVVVESVFAIPGLGRLAFEAVAGRDLPLLLGVVLVGTLVVIAVNLIVDIAYAWLDPRVGVER